MSGLKDALKLVVGRSADVVYPQLGREIDENRNTARLPAVKKAIIYARIHSAKSKCDTVRVEQGLTHFWKENTGNTFHENHADARFDLFKSKHAGVIEALAEELGSGNINISRMVEIGCGDGKVLNYCASELAGIQKFVGLDINSAVISNATQEYTGDPRLSFFEADACEWLEAHPQPGTVLLSNGGVLEYLSQPSVDRLFKSLMSASPAAVVLVEPVAPNHNLKAETESCIFGYENSFSHNHRTRLETAGFKVVFQQEMNLSSIRWMLIVAVTR